MIVGKCLHLAGTFICTGGKHQNFPCPFLNNVNKCPNCIVVTEEMAQQFKEQGYVRIDLQRKDIAND